MLANAISRRACHRIGATLLLFAAALGLTGDASGDPIAQAGEDGGRVWLSTGLVTFRPGRAVRVNVVETDSGRAPRTVRVSIRDGERRLVRETIGEVTPTKPLFLDLARREVPPGSEVAIRTEFELACEGEDDSGPVTTMELFEVATGTIEDVTTCGCPCCPGVPSQPVRPGVMTHCGGMRLEWNAGGP